MNSLTVKIANFVKYQQLLKAYHPNLLYLFKGNLWSSTMRNVICSRKILFVDARVNEDCTHTVSRKIQKSQEVKN